MNMKRSWIRNDILNNCKTGKSRMCFSRTSIRKSKRDREDKDKKHTFNFNESITS